MADPNAPAPSDSVTFGQFSGLRNTVTRERLGPDDLEIARNVDLDDARQLRRRRGSTKVASGQYHSLFRADDGTVYGVKDGTLGVVNANYTVIPIFPAGEEPLAYVQVADTIYYSSPDVSGKIIHSTKQRKEWGSLTGDIWHSVVVNPVVDSLAPLKGKLLGKPPLATALAQMSGRIYLAQGRVLWVTELFKFDYVDKTKGFQQYESDITVLAPVTDGMFVGTGNAIYFLRGSYNEMVRTDALNAGALPGSVVYVEPQYLPQGVADQSRLAILVMTTSGLYAGLDGGRMVSLTQGRFEFPDATRLSGMLRHQDGISQYVGVADSGGSPAGSMRIGDYVDAEIRRFQGA
jgi:hypothetical protein